MHHPYRTRAALPQRVTIVSRYVSALLNGHAQSEKQHS